MAWVDHNDRGHYLGATAFYNSLFSKLVARRFKTCYSRFAEVDIKCWTEFFGTTNSILAV